MTLACTILIQLTSVTDGRTDRRWQRRAKHSAFVRKNGDLSDISNYRLIALATIFSKIFEHATLNRMYEYLKTSDNQFGFKRGHSTLMPILLLKELLRFYCDQYYVCVFFGCY